MIKNEQEQNEKEKITSPSPEQPPINPENIGRVKRKYKAREKKKVTTPEEEAALQKQVEELYKPENFEGLVRLPADIAFAVTGKDLWQLGDEEVKSLSVTGAQCCKTFLQTDPKYLVLAMFLGSVALVYGSRIMRHLKEKKDETDKHKIPTDRINLP